MLRNAVEGAVSRLLLRPLRRLLLFRHGFFLRQDDFRQPTGGCYAAGLRFIMSGPTGRDKGREIAP
jgi:hypothetical protein